MTKTKEIAKKYMMHQGEDGVIWITIQPLLEQVMMHRKNRLKLTLTS